MSNTAANQKGADRGGRADASRQLSWLASELVVVFIGVVLGLAFNAWWEEVQDQKDLQLSLARLLDNLTTTVTDLQGDVAVMDQSWESARILINSEVSRLPDGTAALALMRLLDTRTPIPESAEYKALTSTGKLREITNAKIITGVTAAYEQLPYLQRLSNTSAGLAGELRDMLAAGIVYEELGDFSFDYPPFRLNHLGLQLLANDDVRAKIVYVGFWARFQAEKYRIVIAEIEDAIANIEAELR